MSFKKFARILVSLFFVVAISTGCSTIIHGNSDRVVVHSMEKGTQIFVDGMPRGKNYAELNLKRGDDHTILVKKPGCQDMLMQTNSQFDPTSLLGVFIDLGIISIPIDLISGAAWKTSPTSYSVSPICG